MKNLQPFHLFERKLDSEHVDPTAAVFLLVKSLLKGKGADVTDYSNGDIHRGEESIGRYGYREEGYHITLGDNAVSFAQKGKGSRALKSLSAEVVYYGKVDDFEDGIIKDELYKTQSVYYKIDTEPEKIAKSIADFLLGKSSRL